MLTTPHPPTILVIDDHAAMAYTVQQAVPEAEVRYAAHGIEGLSQLRQHQVDLIVLDIMMPWLDGRATCLRIREINRTIPILPFTAYPDVATLQMLAECGCHEPIIKPVDPAVLATAIRQALQLPTPAMEPGVGVLGWAQEQAAQQEAARRLEQAPSVLICAQDTVVRHGLRALLTQAGARVIGHTMVAANLPQMIPPLERVTAFVTVAADMAAVVAVAQPHAIPLLGIAGTIDAALTIAELAQHVTVPLGLVIELPHDEQYTHMAIADTLRQVGHGATVIPGMLQTPFADSDLTSSERTLLMGMLRGQSVQELARRAHITPDSVRQYRKRLRHKLQLAEEQSFEEWATTWLLRHLALMYGRRVQE